MDKEIENYGMEQYLLDYVNDTISNNIEFDKKYIEDDMNCNIKGWKYDFDNDFTIYVGDDRYAIHIEIKKY